jgi:alpha-L-fucosidase 2
VNSFHLNGDQTGKGYSSFTYRPFTLEGNFAYASGLQEMLLQSHAGYINLFPAIPADWSNCSFKNFRTQGAFLVDASSEGGKAKRVLIRSEKRGEIKVWLGEGTWKIRQQKSCETDLSKNGWLILKAEAGGLVELSRNE